MVMPLAGRVVAAVIGGLLVLTAAYSVTGTLIVSRSVSSRLTRWVDKVVVGAYRLAIKWYVHKAPTDSPHAIQMAYKRADRLLATQAAAILLCQLAAWLVVAYVGFALLLWPFATHGVVSAFIDSGSSLFTLGFAVPAGAGPAVIVFLAAATGLVIVTLQIAYLPTLYAAFNRRETEVALLNARAGVPSWGPELLARTHYALGLDLSTLDTMPDLYAQWERWAADVAESHSTYLPLVRFRSPGPLSSWVTALLAVLDSAALYLALSPDAAPTVPARLCLRSGFLCFGEIARAMRLKVPDSPDPDAGISLTYEEFLDAVGRMREVDFPIERKPDEAWPEFVGWRVNYEQAAYAIAQAVEAVPALWSGPRRHGVPPIPPIRPAAGRMPKDKKKKQF
ncbi:MAG TPA: hypothetical protein VED20_07600, partial [Streptosporangiaceae bacterium]|nr:hypothetical protein [Streptosporangiaceae bacterium]